MYRGNSSRIFPIVIVLIVIAIAIAALVSVGKAIFGGSDQPSQTDTTQQALLDTSIGNSVRMNVRGPLVADEDFRSYSITVDSQGRTLTTYSGYLDQTIDSKQLGNNVKAYTEFVHALNYANITSSTDLTGSKDDTSGICATGHVYEFEILHNGNVTKRLWTSTCKGSPGSFRGSVDQVQALFLTQIPNNTTILRNIDL